MRKCFHMRDFEPLKRCTGVLLPVEVLHSSDLGLVTETSKMSVTNYQSTLLNILKERRTQHYPTFKYCTSVFKYTIPFIDCLKHRGYCSVHNLL